MLKAFVREHPKHNGYQMACQEGHEMYLGQLKLHRQAIGSGIVNYLKDICEWKDLSHLAQMYLGLIDLRAVAKQHRRKNKIKIWDELESEDNFHDKIANTSIIFQQFYYAIAKIRINDPIPNKIKKIMDPFHAKHLTKLKTIKDSIADDKLIESIPRAAANKQTQEEISNRLINSANIRTNLNEN
jgi:hypothetical protein